VLLTLIYEYCLELTNETMSYTQFIDVNRLEYLYRTSDQPLHSLDPLTHNLVFAAVRDASKQRFSEDITKFLNTYPAKVPEGFDLYALFSSVVVACCAVWYAHSCMWWWVVVA
jgi:hypothetical protein